MRGTAGILGLALAMVAGVGIQREVGGEDGPEVDRGQVARWVGNLADGRYDVREQATRQLIEVGGPAIEPLTHAITGTNPEVTIRGVFILQELALSGREPTELAALESLERLAGDRGNSAAGRAREALAVLDELRQQRALRELQRLGAVVDTDYREVGLTLGGIFAVEFGPLWKGTVSDLRHLRWLKEVEQVSFIGPQVTDEWFPHLIGMDGLAIVKVRRGQISNQALAALPQLPRLHYVKLLYVSIDDQSMTHFQNCPQVGRVLLYGTQVTEEGATNLRNRGVDVDLRRGAFLGISVPPANEGELWFVDSITPGSAADRAGLQPRDVITRFNDRDVQSFSDLRAMIAEYDAGDTVDIEVRRRGEVFEKKITFGEWD